MSEGETVTSGAVVNEDRVGSLVSDDTSCSVRSLSTGGSLK